MHYIYSSLSTCGIEFVLALSKMVVEIRLCGGAPLKNHWIHTLLFMLVYEDMKVHTLYYNAKWISWGWYWVHKVVQIMTCIAPCNLCMSWACFYLFLLSRGRFCTCVLVALWMSETKQMLNKLNSLVWISSRVRFCSYKLVLQFCCVSGACLVNSSVYCFATGWVFFAHI